jgi:hypothetical protein
MKEPVMTRDEVAQYLGISPESVRSALRPYGITARRGYLRSEIEGLERNGQGRRTDLHDVHDTHREGRECRDASDLRGWPSWRWTCTCGSRGHWNNQSPNVAHYAWAKHAGVAPNNNHQDKDGF